MLWIAKEPKKPSRFPTKLDIPQSMLNSWQKKWWYQVISSVIPVCITWYDMVSSPLDTFRAFCPMILSSCSVHCGSLASRASEMRWLKSKTKEESNTFSASSGSFNLHSSACGKKLLENVESIDLSNHLLSSRMADSTNAKQPKSEHPGSAWVLSHFWAKRRRGTPWRSGKECASLVSSWVVCLQLGRVDDNWLEYHWTDQR